MKIFLKSVLILLALLIIVFVIWYSNVGRENLYYIEEADIYIKTFPSRETAIIAFSDKKINKFSGTLDYIKVNKGDDYYTNFFFDTKDKTVIYSRSNSVRDVHLVEYRMEAVQSCDTTYYERRYGSSYCSLKHSYTGISFYLCGASERVSLKNREDIGYTEIRPIGK